ncbi:MAG TPA: glycosyltransferase family 9 protein [Candidatus Dormibacteraeota bacterium]
MRPHVLVARLDNNGDLLLAGPAIRAVASGARTVTLLCGPRGVDAARLLPGLDHLIVFRAPWIDAEPPPVDPVAIATLVDDLRQRRIDEAILLTSYHQSALPLALLLRTAGVPVIAAISEDYPGSLLDIRHRVPDDIHEVERNLSLVATLGYRLPADDDGRLRIKRPSPPTADVPYVVVHPGATAPARTWPVAHHAALVRTLSQSGHKVVVTGGASETALTATVAGGDPRVTDLGGRIDFAQLADVIAAAEVLVAGNTGPAHLAAAVGTPIVSLFAPVVPAVRWQPWRVPQVLLGDQHAACAGSRARACPIPGHPCLSKVTVDAVMTAIHELAANRMVMAS